MNGFTYGTVIFQKYSHAVAPSRVAASRTETGIPCNAAINNRICIPLFQTISKILSATAETRILTLSLIPYTPMNSRNSPIKSADNNVEDFSASLIPETSISPLITLYTEPVTIITGRKNTALAKVRPLKFWLSTTAINIENIIISGVFQSVSISISVRYSVYFSSSVRTFIYLSNPVHSITVRPESMVTSLNEYIRDFTSGIRKNITVPTSHNDINP